MSDLTAKIQRVLQLDREATGGPWKPTTDIDYEASTATAVGPMKQVGGGSPMEVAYFGAAMTRADAALIAEYRTAAPSLARALVAEQARVADLERQIANEADEQTFLRLALKSAGDGNATLAAERDALRADLADALKSARHFVCKVKDRILANQRVGDLDYDQLVTLLGKIDAALAGST